MVAVKAMTTGFKPGLSVKRHVVSLISGEVGSGVSDRQCYCFRSKVGRHFLINVE